MEETRGNRELRYGEARGKRGMEGVRGGRGTEEDRWVFRGIGDKVNPGE